MQDNTMDNNEGSRQFTEGFALSIPGLIIAAGFALVVFSTFLDFTPVCLRSWRAGGVGLPVMLFSMAGIVLALRRNFFTTFFIGVFAAFFLTHEIIVIYDNRAVELAQELKPDGWFRSVIQVYLDALQPKYGAFWGIIGVTIATLVPLIGIAFEVRQKNLEAAYTSERTAQFEDTEYSVEDAQEDGDSASDYTESEDYDSEYEDDIADDDDGKNARYS